MLPIILPVFGTMPLIALPANLLAAPIVGPLTVWGLVAGVVGGVLGPGVARVLQLPTYALLRWVETVARTAATHPVAIDGRDLIGLVALGCIGAVLLRRPSHPGAMNRLPRIAARSTFSFPQRSGQCVQAVVRMTGWREVGRTSRRGSNRTRTRNMRSKTMKLAEALLARKELQVRANELVERSVATARYQEGETPAEDAAVLVVAATDAFQELGDLVARIDQTNASHVLENGMTLTRALAERETLARRRALLTRVAEGASGRATTGWAVVASCAPSSAGRSRYRSPSCTTRPTASLVSTGSWTRSSNRRTGRLIWTSERSR